jgi:hypothetical protein
LTVHGVAQHFTSGGLHAPFAHCTAHEVPVHATSLHASLPLHAMSVWPAALRTRRQACSPVHSTWQLEAVSQSTPAQLCMPEHVTLHATLGGHVIELAHPDAPGHAIVHVAPEHVPPAAGHAAAQAAMPGSTGVSSPGAPPSPLPSASASPESSGSFAVVRFGSLTQATIVTATSSAATASVRTMR